jgi:hypothetical protein
MPETAMPARFELEELESKDLQTHLTESDIERELGDLHAKHGTLFKPEDYQ